MALISSGFLPSFAICKTKLAFLSLSLPRTSSCRQCSSLLNLFSPTSIFRFFTSTSSLRHAISLFLHLDLCHSTFLICSSDILLLHFLFLSDLEGIPIPVVRALRLPGAVDDEETVDAAELVSLVPTAKREGRGEEEEEEE